MIDECCLPKQVDKVKIDNIKSFKSPQELGERVLSVEKDKDGYMDGRIVSVSDGLSRGGVPYYSVDYIVESTRGKNHYTAKAAIADHKLYVLTVQIKDADYTQSRDDIDYVLQSLDIHSDTSKG